MVHERARECVCVCVGEGTHIGELAIAFGILLSIVDFARVCTILLWCCCLKMCCASDECGITPAFGGFMNLVLVSASG